MSEERFVVGSNEIGEIIVTDVETDKVYFYDNLSNFFGLIRLLNEQQATINELKAQLREKEEDEKLYANEIVKLNKEAKEVLDFKSLGGDY